MAEVLVIEDDSASRDLLLRILAPEGHSVIFAENGAVGLKKLAEARVDIVLTDLLMPVLEGLETIREIRRLQSNVKIVAISGIYSDYLDAAIALGANATLRKPIQPSALRDTMATLLSEPSAGGSSRTAHRKRYQSG